MAESTEIERLLAAMGLVVTYSPLRTEVLVDDLVAIPGRSAVYRIPARASLDPLEEARKVIALGAGKDAVLLIPGRRFDASGTRHGQGGGWYDRFLAETPRQWLRIGFCFDDQFSPEPLHRESWDQTMDYIAVVDRKSRGVTLYSTEGAQS